MLQYFYTQMNNNQMQRELFHDRSLYVYTLQSFEVGHDADPWVTEGHREEMF